MKVLLKLIPILVVIAAGAYFARSLMVNETIEQLLTENTELKTAITHLNAEEQIGYAKVLSQETRDGVLYTKVLFVETDPSDLTKHILTKEYEIAGDIIHFDALIIKFDNSVVMDGTERAMYLWRRVYGETMTPEQGLPIETEGSPSPRYEQICEKLSIAQSQLFWNEIWNLADEPKRLEACGVQAIFGNVIYRRLQPGLIYVFKVSATGTLYPEIVPDL